MTHDYEAALNHFIDMIEPQIYNSTKRRKDAIAAIESALKLAAKVTSEPSEGMIKAAISSYNNNGEFALVTHFKAMVSQAMGEV